MKSDKREDESEGLAGFKRWVISLNREQLLDAMAFAFKPHTNDQKSSTAKPLIPSLDESASTIVYSHEYELLLSMVQLQPPPPTPVHPRAAGYKPRSQKGVRLDYFYKEEEHLRWTKPRLFQLAVEEELSLFHNNSGRRVNHRNCSRNRNANATRRRRFNVIARQKVAPWGDVYSLGSTQEQYDADYKLINGTRLGRYRRDGRFYATACFVCSERKEMPDKEYNDAHRIASSEARNYKSDANSSGGPPAASILKMLRIASRGQFFRQHPVPFDSNIESAEVSFCAPWLQPTERWFSLSMYLASRFQIALLDSYLNYQSNRDRRYESTLQKGRHIRLGGNGYCFKESVLKNCLMRAIRSGLRDILKREQTSSQLNFLRDGTLWSILEGSHKGHRFLSQIPLRSLPATQEGAEGYWKSIALFWTQTKLVEMHIPFNSKFKSLVNEKFEEELVAQMEKEIFEEDQLERHMSFNSVVKKRKKKKPKRKKNRNCSMHKEVLQRSSATPTNIITPSGMDGKSDTVTIPSDSSSVEVERTSMCLSNTKFEFPQNLITANERNRNIIFVLGIIEDITENVFSKIGLISASKFEESGQDVVTFPANCISKSNSSLLGPSQQEENVNKCNSGIEVPIDISSENHTFKSFTSSLIRKSRSFDQELTNHIGGNVFSLCAGQNESFGSNMYNPFAVGSDFELNNLDDIGGYVDDWCFSNRYQSRKHSILTNFFESQNGKMDNDDDDEERLMTASTAASIASSTCNDTAYVAETEELTVPDNVVTERSGVCAEMSAIRENDDVCSRSSNGTDKNDDVAGTVGNAEKTPSVISSPQFEFDIKPTCLDEDRGRLELMVDDAGSNHGNESGGSRCSCRSPTLQAPTTPPPTLSPIVVSLADLKKVKKNPSLDFNNATTLSGSGSLPPNSPSPQGGIVYSLESFRDDDDIGNQQRGRIISQRGLEIATYKSIAVKALTKPISSSRDDTGSLDHELQFPESQRRRQPPTKDCCAQSETAMDTDQREHQDWCREEAENQSLTKDETTTIISGISHRVESEELAVVQEERNNFRDMCLTLGAEVAKLKVMLATQQAVAAAPVDYQDSSFGYSKMYGHGSFDPHGMQPFFNGMNNGLHRGPMSDAGFHRYGDHESLFSEDEVYDPISKAREARMDSVQRMASSQTIASQTVAGSDASIDFSSIKGPMPGGQMPGTMTAYDSFHFNGLQSRLAKDILQFLDATNVKMKNLDGRRKLAVQRFSRLVKTVWPRAQVKLYGSYISGLCLPSSDLDFVVCLPAVHKKDLALAPGVLEGRNAINETSQKLLARELKGESWIDPRSIKVIERTAVPVIKVSTKDTRARMIQLDISFDGPEHHGLDANRMVAQTLEELPIIRPLMLVLKQFLLHRGLLTAYTGGLSSYCLLLMLARYLQEQPPSSGDCGSLLMGFLDFYGNFFDPRAIGISVGGRRFFARANSNTAAAGYEPTGQPIWNRSLPPHQQHQKHVVINNLPPNSSSNSVTFRRRNSFSDTGSVDDNRHRHRLFSKPATTTSTAVPSGPNHRFVPLNNNTQSTHPKEINFRSSANTNNFSGYYRPSTFDPLFVEDPLSATNNVGRNAFRINQVQRAFSDAHRALVASLDWDIQAAEGNGKYPLLKCLLGNQRDDVLSGI